MIVVSPAEHAQAEAIINLAEEMDRFYGETEPELIEIRLRQTNEALFGDPPSAFAQLAWDGPHLVGLATYSFLWPAVGLTRSLFLKELYVAESARRRGVGTRLMNSVIQVAQERDCSRMEWQTEASNGEARSFYSALGGQEFKGKVLFRLEGEGLSKAATR